MADQITSITPAISELGDVSPSKNKFMLRPTITIGTIGSTEMSPPIDVRMEQVDNFGDLLAGDFGKDLREASDATNLNRTVLRSIFMKDGGVLHTVWSSESWKGVNSTTSSQHYKLFGLYEAYRNNGNLQEENYLGKTLFDKQLGSFKFAVFDADKDLSVAFAANLIVMNKGASFDGTLDIKDNKSSPSTYLSLRSEDGTVLKIFKKDDLDRSVEIELGEVIIDGKNPGEIAGQVDRLLSVNVPEI